MNPILLTIAFVSFWGGVVSMMLNHKETNGRNGAANSIKSI